MTVDTRLMTAGELLQMPDDGMRHELVRGELTTMSPSGYRRGVIAGRIAVLLGQYVLQNRLGEISTSKAGFLLERSPDTLRAPDLAFVRANRATDEKGFFAGPPDLAVEVMSPNDRFTEVIGKVREYLRAGVEIVIVVDPENEAAWIHSMASEKHLTINDSLEAPGLLPGWSLPLRDLFA